MLGIPEDFDDRVVTMPSEVETKFVDYDHSIFGQFEVCPFTKEKEGEMQLVCVSSASHLVVAKR